MLRHGVVLLAALMISACSSAPMSVSGSVPVDAAQASEKAGADGESAGGTFGTQQRGAENSTGQGGKAAGVAPGLPTQDQLDQARRDVSALSVRDLAAQLIVPRQRGRGATAAEDVRTLHVGGVTVFGGNIPTDPAQVASAVKSTNRELQNAMQESGRDWPAFIAIDQEGGPVTRIDEPLTRFPSLMAVGAAGDEAVATEVARASGSELRGLGYTVVLAPSADVTVGPEDPTIGVRSPGSDPERVTKVAGWMSGGYLGSGLLPTIKHFPGHGSVTGDTHTGAVALRGQVDQLLERDLRPFAELADEVPAIMAAHVGLSAVDPDNPSTLSQKVLTGLLRDRLGFRGLIVTDGMDMRAISDRHGAGEAAVRAVLAGADVILLPADTAQAIDALESAVESGRLTKERLVDSAARMVAALRAAAAGAGTETEQAPGSHAEVARRLADASITQLGGECGKAYGADGIRITGGSEGDRAELTRAAREAGLATGRGARVVLIDGGAYRAAENGSTSASGQTSARGDIVVALDRPYVLARSAGTVKFATYGRTPATFSALAGILAGRQPARGHLPVRVGSNPVGSGCR